MRVQVRDGSWLQDPTLGSARLHDRSVVLPKVRWLIALKWKLDCATDGNINMNSWINIAKDMYRRSRIVWTRHDEISYQDIRNRRVDWDGRILGSAHRWIPAITDMFLKLSDHNSILKSLGLNKRLPNKFKFYQLAPNMKMNKYMEFQVKRLRSLARKKPAKFWRVSWKLMISSTAFRVSVVNTVYKGWYKTLTWGNVMRINRQATVILKNMRKDLAIHRVYIPKTAGAVRPLGVPKDSWRVALKLLHNFMSIFLEGVISTKQHAYQPGKGCLTAWRDLVPKLFSYPNIWEYDLKGCFDEIRLDWVSNRLANLGVPGKFVDWIEGINLAVPTFPKELKADESRQIFKALEQGLPQKTSVLDRMDPADRDLAIMLMCEDLGIDRDRVDSKVLDDMIRAQFEAMEQYNDNPAPLTKNRGLAQGSNLSPLLTILALEVFFNRLEDWIAYADDFLRFSFTNRETVVDDIETGVIINWKKSKQLKKDGVWLVDKFKFLGLEFLTHSGEIQGATRNGSTLKMNSMARDVWDINWLCRKDNDWNGIEALFNQSLGGWFQSKLFQNTWELVFYEWHSRFQRVGIWGSLLFEVGLEDNCVSTSSYCCMLLGQRLDKKKRMRKQKKHASSNKQ